MTKIVAFKQVIGGLLRSPDRLFRTVSSIAFLTAFAAVAGGGAQRTPTDMLRSAAAGVGVDLNPQAATLHLWMTQHPAAVGAITGLIWTILLPVLSLGVACSRPWTDLVRGTTARTRGSAAMLLCFAVAVETSGGRVHWTATLLSIAVLTLASVGLGRMLGLKATFLEVVAAALYAVVMPLCVVGAWLFEPRPAVAQSN